MLQYLITIRLNELVDAQQHNDYQPHWKEQAEAELAGLTSLSLCLSAQVYSSAGLNACASANK